MLYAGTARTVSWTAITEPWEHQAQVLAVVYQYRSDLQAQGRISSADQIHRIRLVLEGSYWLVHGGPGASGGGLCGGEHSKRLNLIRWVKTRLRAAGLVSKCIYRKFRNA